MAALRNRAASRAVRPRPARSCGVVALVSLLAMALPAGGSGAARAATPTSAYRRVLQVYEQQSAVPPCLFTTRQLTSALKGVDVYGQQYFADFTTAIQGALAQRAAGACLTASSTAAGPAAPQTAVPLGSLTAGTGAGVPAPLLLLGAFTVLLTLAAGGLVLARAQGWDHAPIGPGRHLWREAAWRAEGLWQDFRDWLRPV